VATAEQRVGTSVGGRYDLVALIGVGGMGAVYEAEHRVTRRRVAVKLLKTGLDWSRELVERFLREAQAAAAIGHPGIVDVLDAGEEPDGSLFVVTELLEGETLGARIERSRPMALGEAIGIATDVLGALAAAHAKGIVHRDVKPDNVFLSRSRDGSIVVKLLDFGIAKRVAGDGKSVTQSGAALGTPLYMSPEQVRGEKDLDARSDVWAVGVMLYECVTGRPPFEGESGNLVWLAILTKRHAPARTLRRHVPKALGEAIDRALAKDRRKRFASATDLRSALAACLAALPEEAPAPSQVSQDQPAGVGVATTIQATPTDWARSAWSRLPLRGWRLGLAALSILVPLAGLTAYVAAENVSEVPTAPSTIPVYRSVDGTSGTAGLPPLPPVTAGSSTATAPGSPAPVPRGLWQWMQDMTAPAPVPTSPALVPAQVRSTVTLTLRGLPRGAVVTVDGNRVRPPSVVWPRGEEEVAVRVAAPGFAPRTFRVSPAQDRDVEVALRPVRQRRPASPRPATSEPRGKLDPMRNWR